MNFLGKKEVLYSQSTGDTSLCDFYIMTSQVIMSQIVVSQLKTMHCVYLEYWYYCHNSYNSRLSYVCTLYSPLLLKKLPHWLMNKFWIFSPKCSLSGGGHEYLQSILLSRDFPFGVDLWCYTSKVTILLSTFYPSRLFALQHCNRWRLE